MLAALPASPLLLQGPIYSFTLSGGPRRGPFLTQRTNALPVVDLDVEPGSTVAVWGSALSPLISHPWPASFPTPGELGPRAGERPRFS